MNEVVKEGGRQTNILTDGQIFRLRDRPTSKETDKQTGSQRIRQNDSQRERECQKTEKVRD